MHGLSLVVVSGGHSSLRCLSSVAVALGLYSAGSVVVAHGLCCFGACGIFPDQGWSLHSLHGQMDSQPLDHQGEGPYCFFQREFFHFHCLYVCFPLCVFHVQISLRERFCLGSLHPDEMAPTESGFDPGHPFLGTGQSRGRMPVGQMLVLGPISCGQGSRVAWWKTNHPVDDERGASERGHWWVGITKLLRNACVGCLVLRNKIDSK